MKTIREIQAIMLIIVVQMFVQKKKITSQYGSRDCRATLAGRSRALFYGQKKN